MSRRGLEEERECPSRLCIIVESNMGLKLTNLEIMTWAEIKSQMLNQLSHPDAPLNFFNVCLFMFVYFWGGEGQREWDTEFEASSRLPVISTEPDVELELTNCEITTWAKVGCLTDSATQAPQCLFFREREREAEGKGDRRSEVGSALTAESPLWPSNPWTARSWPEPESDAQHTEPPRHSS